MLYLPQDHARVQYFPIVHEQKQYFNTIIDGFHSIFHHRNQRAKGSCDAIIKQHGDVIPASCDSEKILWHHLSIWSTISGTTFPAESTAHYAVQHFHAVRLHTIVMNNSFPCVNACEFI